MKKKVVIEDPENMYEAKVRVLGNGAYINALKKDIGKKAIVIIKKSDRKQT